MYCSVCDLICSGDASLKLGTSNEYNSNVRVRVPEMPLAFRLIPGEVNGRRNIYGYFTFCELASK